MANDLKLVNNTTQDFVSAKDVELFEVRWEKWVKNIMHYYLKVV